MTGNRKNERNQLILPAGINMIRKWNQALPAEFKLDATDCMQWYLQSRIITGFLPVFIIPHINDTIQYFMNGGTRREYREHSRQ